MGPDRGWGENRPASTAPGAAPNRLPEDTPDESAQLQPKAVLMGLRVLHILGKIKVFAQAEVCVALLIYNSGITWETKFF